MRTQVRNRLVMTRGPVSARRPSGSPDTYSWVWVLPIPDGRYRVAAIEVPKELVENNVSFFEDDMRTVYLRILDSLDGIDDAVREAGVDPDELDAPWHNDFPL